MRMIVGPIIIIYKTTKTLCSYEGQKRTYSEIKSRSMHSRMPFPFASPCSLKGGIRAGVTDDRFNVVRAGIKSQPSLAAALFRLHWCWCCCWCKKVPGRAAPASWRGGGGWSWPCVRPVAGSGRPRQSWRTLQPPALCSATLHFPAVLRARNFVLRCRLVHRGGTLSYLQCWCALCWEQQFPAVPSAREIFNVASELELENVGTLWWKKRGRNTVATLF